MDLHTSIFWLVLFLAPALFSSFIDKQLKEKHLDEKQKQKIKTTKGLYTILFIFMDLFYISVVNNWTWCIYIFGMILAAMLYTGLISTILSEFSFMAYIIPFDLVFDVGLVVYLIYKINDPNLRTIVLTIVAALFGSITTLIGVYWGIKSSRKEKKEQLMQSVRPIMYLVSDLYTLENLDSQNNSSENPVKEIGFIHNVVTVPWYFCCIHNTDNGIFLCKELIINDECHCPSIITNDVIDKNTKVKIVLWHKENDTLDINSACLVGTDIYGNEKKYELILKQFTDENINNEYIKEIV